MGMRFNPDWHEGIKRHFCGSEKSVKYKVDIEVDGEIKEVNCCSKCVCQHAHDAD